MISSLKKFKLHEVMISFDLTLSWWSGGPYHIETSPLICWANLWTGFYMIGTTVMKELIEMIPENLRSESDKTLFRITLPELLACHPANI